MLRNPFAKRNPPSPSGPTYADIFEVMRFDRGADAIPYVIGYRLKVSSPNDPGPSFTLLDTDIEVEAFYETLKEPVILAQTGLISVAPLDRWNETPSAIMTDLLVRSVMYPEDESLGWPYIEMFAIPPSVFAAGKAKPDDAVRGRYNFRIFPPEDREQYEHEWHKARDHAGSVDMFLGGKIPFSLVEMLNPRKPGSSYQ